MAERGSALIYANRSYGASQPIIVPKSTRFGGAGSSGTVSVGCFHTFAPFFIPELVGELARSGDGLSVNLIEGDNRRIKESLLSGESEIGLLYDFDLPDSLETTLVSKLTPYVLLSVDSPLAKKDAIEDMDLDGQPMISIAEDQSRDQLEGALRARGVDPKVIFRAASFEMMRGMVGQGLGFALAMTKSGVQQSYDGRKLIARPLAVPLPSHSIVLAKRHDETLSPAASTIYEKAYASSSWS